MNEQLKQIAAHPVWDGNLISKTMRDDLVKCGYVDQIFTAEVIIEGSGQNPNDGKPHTN